MPTPRNRYIQWSRSALVANVPVGPTPTGDQNAYNDGAKTAWDGLGAPLRVGTNYVSASTFAAGTSWSSLADERIATWGLFDVPWAATAALKGYVRGQGSDQPVRGIIYGDNGSGTTTTVQPTAGASRPQSLTWVGVEQVIGAAQAVGDVTLGTGISLAQALYWPGLWYDDAATDAQILTYNAAQVSKSRYRTNLGITTYSSSGAPPATFPASSTGLAASYPVLWLECVPSSITAPSNLTATADGLRRIALTWTGNDARTSRYRVERRKNAGAWGTHAVINGTSFIDDDLQLGAVYEYRIVACLYGGASSPSATASATAQGVRYASATVTLSALAASTRVDNPLRGLHGADFAIGTVSVFEDFKRTGFEWVDLEPTQGNYDFTAIETFLASLGANERGWIRFRASVPGLGDQLPAYITTNPAYYNIAGDGTYYPNHNDAFVFGRLQALANAIGAAFNNDSRLALIDMGIIAQFGEWTGAQGTDPITPANAITLITTICTAFSNKYVVMSLYDDNAVLEHALNQSNVIGVRQDAYGDLTNPYMWLQHIGRRYDSLTRRIMGATTWRTGEWTAAFTDAQSTALELAKTDAAALDCCSVGNANMTNYGTYGAANQARVLDSINASGYRVQLPSVTYPPEIVNNQAFALTLGYRNIGNGMLPESAPVQLQLRDGGGSVVWSSTLSLDVRSMQPAAGTALATALVSVSGVAAGVYTLALQVPASGRRPALAFDVTGVQSGTWYSVASVSVL